MIITKLTNKAAEANEMKQAKEAEIVANQEVAIKEQDSIRHIGLRTAEVDQEVGIANEKAKQEVQAQVKVTAEKEMEVQRVREVKAAEIAIEPIIKSAPNAG